MTTKENSFYIITPPDLKLSSSNENIGVLIIGEKEDSIQEYINIYDQIYPELEILIYHCNVGLTEKNAAWYKAAACSCIDVIINLDNITKEEVLFATKLDNVIPGNIHWFSNNNENKLLKSLITSFDNVIFDSIKSFEYFLESSKKNA